jgi:hypothetical protein
LLNKFSSIQEAFKYCEYCPVCKRFIINKASKISYHGDCYNGAEFLLGNSCYKTIYFSNNNLNVAVDYKRNIIKSIELKNNHIMRDYYGGTICCNESREYKYIKNFLTFYNFIYCPQECYDCTMKIYIDIKNPKFLNKIELQSERVFIAENDVDHFITNTYTNKETIYKIIHNNNDENILTIPLISDNLSNPQETLERIKKLLPFT